MKKLALALLLAASFNAWADDASQRKAIDELLSLTKAESVVTNMRRQLDAQTVQMITNMAQGKPSEALTTEQRAAAQRFSAQITQLFDDNLSWATVKELTVKVYMETFSEAEIAEIVEFYKTPLGQKILDKMPAVMEATTRNTSAQIQAMLPKLDQIGRQFAAEFEKGAAGKEKPAAKAGKSAK